MNSLIRIFIAVNLPENIIYSIGKVIEDIKLYNFKVRWVRPENTHLTLKFLGNINVSDIQMIGDAMKEAACNYAPISLAAKGIEIFPDIRRPRVIWIGLTGDISNLASLQKDIDKKLAKTGFAKEKRPFKGHLTIGRVKGRIEPEKIADVLNKFDGFESKTFSVDKIYLIQSELKPKGAIYTNLLSAKLQ